MVNVSHGSRLALDSSRGIVASNGRLFRDSLDWPAERQVFLICPCVTSVALVWHKCLPSCQTKGLPNRKICILICCCKLAT
jgi:hypothetical protein